MKRVVFAFAALAAMTTIAAAADLGRPAPYYPAPAPVYAAIYNWTGFYIGVNGGGGFGSSSWDSTGSRNISGGLIGGTVGLGTLGRNGGPTQTMEPLPGPGTSTLLGIGGLPKVLFPVRREP